MIKICEDLAKNLIGLMREFDTVLIYGLQSDPNDIFFVTSCLKPVDVFATGLVPLAVATKTTDKPSNECAVRFWVRFDGSNFRRLDVYEYATGARIDCVLISRADYDKQIVYCHLNFELHESRLDQARKQSYCFNYGIQALIGEKCVFRKDEKLNGDVTIAGLFGNAEIPIELQVTSSTTPKNSSANNNRKYTIANYTVFSRSQPITELYGRLVANLYANIDRCIQFYRLNRENASNLQTFRFRLPETNSEFVFIDYDRTKSDRDLSAARETYVRSLGLSTKRPLIRKSNFEMADIKHDRIVNVHQYVKMDASRRMHWLVDGSYLYYHYDQDGEQDNGWGCAFRSLQTIISYFRLKGYTDEPVPRLRTIQETLVMLGDKPLQFIGSRQWIGSIEISYCLDSLIDVQSRIVHLTGGQSIDTIAEQLIDHFRNESGAPPIMIGSGQLAHTILGVSAQLPDYTNIRYLVLDPHYSGSDTDPNTVVASGACAWKTAAFWKKTGGSKKVANYANLCLPIVPRTF